MRVFTPDQSLALPTKTGDVLTQRLLRRGEPYLVNDSTAGMLEPLIRAGNVKGTLAFAEARPITADTERRLVFFAGEIGDSLCAGRACSLLLETHGPHGRPAFVTTNWDRRLFPSQPVFQYPITLRQAEYYDGWVEFDARAYRDSNIDDAFAKALVPASGVAQGDQQIVKPIALPLGISNAVFSMCADTGRPRIGVRIHADSHYHSWNAAMACVTMAGLNEAGFDCYVLGDGRHRIAFKEDGKDVLLWGENGIYDTCGLFGSVDEYVAFMSGMDLVIAPDSGTLHIACALGLPTLGIFGPTRGEVRSKYNPTLRWIDAEMDCAPCWCVGDRPPCEGKNCEAMLKIEPEQIVETAKEIIGGTT